MTNIAFRQCAECGVHYQSHIESNVDSVHYWGKALCDDCAAKPEKLGAPDCDFSSFEVKWTFKEVGYGKSREITPDEFFTPDFLQKKIDAQMEAKQLEIAKKEAKKLSDEINDSLVHRFFYGVKRLGQGDGK